MIRIPPFSISIGLLIAQIRNLLQAIRVFSFDVHQYIVSGIVRYV